MQHLAVAVEALLGGEQEPAIALLVAQRVPAQAVVPAQQELQLGVEPVGGVGVQLQRHAAAVEVLEVPAQPERGEDVLGARGRRPARQSGLRQQQGARPQTAAVRPAGVEQDRAQGRSQRRQGPAEADPRLATQVEILRTLDLVEVVGGDEAVLDPAPLDPRVDQAPVGRQTAGRRRGGRRAERQLSRPAGRAGRERRQEAVVPVVEAVAQARGGVLGDRERTAAVELGRGGVVAELRRDVAEVVERVDAAVVVVADAGGPGGRERVERTLQEQLLLQPVGGVGVGELGHDPAAEHRMVAVAGLRRRAVDVGLPGQGDVLAGAEQVGVADAEVGGVDAAAVAEVGADVERPDVARGHPQVHRAVGMAPDGPDPRVVEVELGAQEPLRLGDPARREGVTGMDEQKAPDHLRARGGVEAVGEAEEGVVLARLRLVEDVLGVDLDDADPRPVRFQPLRAERGRGRTGRRSRGLREEDRGSRGEAGDAGRRRSGGSRRGGGGEEGEQCLGGAEKRHERSGSAEPGGRIVPALRGPGKTLGTPPP